MIICRFASRTLRVLLHSNDTKGLIRHQNLPCLYESLGIKKLTCRPMSASFLPLAWHKPAAHRALSHTPLHALLHLLGLVDLQGLQDLLCFYCYVSISLKASHQLIKDAYTCLYFNRFSRPGVNEVHEDRPWRLNPCLSRVFLFWDMMRKTLKCSDASISFTMLKIQVCYLFSLKSIIDSPLFSQASVCP